MKYPKRNCLIIVLILLCSGLSCEGKVTKESLSRTMSRGRATVDVAFDGIVSSSRHVQQARVAENIDDESKNVPHDYGDGDGQSYETEASRDLWKEEKESEMEYSDENHEGSDVDVESASDTDIISKLLSDGSKYDWRVRPPGTNLSAPGGSRGPVIVTVDMLIRSISKIDDVNMEYSVQLTFRESWVDGRLAYGLPSDKQPDFFILSDGQKIWMPDSFFQNEKQAQKHMIDKPNVLIRIHKNGVILYSVRISLVLSCPMHLQDYPMDIQTCYIDLASYAYTTDDIVYAWKGVEPVQLKDGLHSSLPSFQLNNVSTGECTSKTNTGAYSCLRTILELRRQFSYYLLQLYVPSTMLVIVSWVSFWLDRTAVPARVTLGVTTLLTMTTQASGINAKLPPVSYTKAIDIWIGACLMFIFGALLEFAWVTYVSSRNFYRSSKENKRSNALLATQQLPTTQLLIPNNNAMECGEVWVKQTYVNEECGETILLNGGTSARRPRYQNRYNRLREFFTSCILVRWIRSRLEIEDHAKRADYLSRIIFPGLFFLFNSVYWFRYSQYNVKTPDGK